MFVSRMFFKNKELFKLMVSLSYFKRLLFPTVLTKLVQVSFSCMMNCLKML